MEIVCLEIRSSFLPLGRRLSQLEEVEGSVVRDLCWEVPKMWRLELHWGHPDPCTPVLVSRSRIRVEEVGPPSHGLVARVSPGDFRQLGERASLHRIYPPVQVYPFSNRDCSGP